jgi:predicted dehydrogenase
MESKKPTRLGLIGCGSHVENAYLPASRQLRDIQYVAVADKNVARAKTFADRYGIPTVADDWSRLPSDVDGVILALPHHLHAPVATAFLEKKTPVLVEKPLALNVEEAKRVIEVARANNTLLQVGQVSRFSHRAMIVKRALEQGWLGNLRSFSLEGNYADVNPMASGFAWNKEQAGGGTLMDVGSLVLDLLIWWFGEPAAVQYWDDAEGGVECECELELELANKRGSVSGKVILSRLRKLRDIVRIDGDRLSIVYGFETNEGLLEIIPADPEYQVPFVLDVRSMPLQTNVDVCAEQVRNFARAIHNPKLSLATAETVLPSLALIEKCYELRQPLQFPWQPVKPVFQTA